MTYTREQLEIIGTERSICEVQEITARHYGMSVRDLQSHRRPGRIVEPRQIAMALTHKQLQVSCIRTGIILARRNHAAVLHACKTVTNNYRTNKFYRQRITPILRECGIDSDAMFYNLMESNRYN